MNANRNHVYEEKDFVGMDLCFICNEAKGVVLDTRLRKRLPRSAVYDREPCDQCKEYMKQGTILISVDEKLTGDDRDNPYRTGGWVVVKEESLKSMIENEDLLRSILTKRVCFIPDQVWDAWELPRGGVNDKNQ